MNVLYKLAIDVLIPALSTIIAFWGFWRKEKAELEKEYSSRFNTKKWEIYTEFTKLTPTLFADESPNMNESTEPIWLDGLASQIVLAGSDKVVTAFRMWRETTEVYGKRSDVTKEKLFRLVVEMRKDLGNKYTRINIEDLLGSLEINS